MSKTVLHKRSVAVVNGKPKLPTSAQTEYGEIAINYAKGHETLTIKNNQNEMVTFSSDNQIKERLDESELVFAAAINDLNTRLLSAGTGSVTEIMSIIEENELNTAAAVNDLYDKVDENEYLTAQAITQLESRIKELETALAGVETILANI